ncbi:hypothetical protein [Vibrio scophthalmi]|uniref:Sel1 repeat family protein n=1 Tax=Vibrio scophthalmi LMG 19158 TaxID=870967 RepID=F9RME8_9VIBR|nr:hypothetical protein [Vibrio scophthalmi]EGU38264.1 hypothetical protein VIS19158_00015 [Vibrio scophthalmi LMG 19158]
MKWSNYYRFLSVAFIFGFSSLLHANQPIDGLTPEQAYQQGTLLYQQNKYNQAKPLLKFAADHNHSPAAAMYASMLFSNTFIQSEGEHEYTLKSAELGNVLAMVAASSRRALSGREHWRTKVTPILERQAKKDDALAMRLLSMLTAFEDESVSFDWLVEAAESGDAFSQHQLARHYEMGDGWFILPGKREKETERFFKAAADSGYWLGMLDYADRLKNRGNIKGYQSIIDELVEAGDALSILGISGSYVDAREYELAAYYSKIYLDSMGNEGKQSGYKAAQSIYDEATLPLTPEQIKQVDLKVQQYLKTHTVRYQKRIKDYEYTLDSFQ